MNKIALSLVAFAAISTAAFAAERTDIDPRDRGDYGSSVSVNTTQDSAAFAVGFEADTGRTLTAFERVTMQSWENENSGH